MTEWDARVQEHEVFSVLDKVDSALEEAGKNEDLAPSGHESIGRLIHGAKYIRSYLDRVDPALVPIKPLDSLAGNLNQLHAEVRNFITSGNVNHLNSAQTSLDPALQTTQYIPMVEGSRDVEGLRESIVEYRRSAGQHVRYLQEEVEQLRTQVAELGSEIEAKSAEVSGQIKAQDQAVSQQIEAQKTEINQQKARLDQAIQTFVQQSSEAREKHSTQVTDIVTSGKEDLSQLLTEAQEQLNTELAALGEKGEQTLAEFKDDAKQRIDDLEQQQGKAADIVGIIARTGMAGGYQQEADEERKQANLWRRVAVGAMAGIVGMAIWMVATVATDATDATSLIAKAFASLTLGILAGYAGREAGKHRRREQRNRRLQLELSSIDAYLESLPDKERNAIKGALADRLFGNPEPPKEDETERVKPSSMMDLIKLLMPSGE